jgi:hypothetical protein
VRALWGEGVAMSGRIRVSAKSERTLDGIVFASKAEMKRYAELRMLERGRVISELVLQPRFVLQEGYLDGPVKVRALEYVADFAYREPKNSRRVVEDVKGHITEVYKIKRKLFRAKYPDIDFREVKA